MGIIMIKGTLENVTIVEKKLLIKKEKNRCDSADYN
jgi:hypothetical protein